VLPLASSPAFFRGIRFWRWLRTTSLGDHCESTPDYSLSEPRTNFELDLVTSRVSPAVPYKMHFSCVLFFLEWSRVWNSTQFETPIVFAHFIWSIQANFNLVTFSNFLRRTAQNVFLE
jgi:hypothetical protein